MTNHLKLNLGKSSIQCSHFAGHKVTLN